ncbi:MAG TPA: hypothetical protein PK280_10135 [Planctomycetota bacterium]|nr:hypothetical protein [Planctomycetota bacterium]
MRGKLLPGLISLVAVLGFACRASSGEGEAEAAPAAGGTYTSNQLTDELNKKIRAYQKESMDKLNAETKAKNEALEKDLNDFLKPREGKFEHNGKTVTFSEPRRPGDVKYEPKDTYRPWALNAEAFRFDLPVEVHESNPAGRDRTYVVLPYSVTNSLSEVKLADKDGKVLSCRIAGSDDEAARLDADAQKLMKDLKLEGAAVTRTPIKAQLTPRITMITDGGVITPETCGFIPHESVEVSTMTKRLWTPELIGFARETAEFSALAPGQTKPGVAIFPRYDPATTSVRFLIEGLADDLNFRKDLRKAMVLEFVRPGNIYYPGQVKLAFKRRIGGKLVDPKAGYVPAHDEDVHHGFDWVWLWNWDAAARLAEAPKSSEMDTPTGAAKQKFWFYKLSIPNRTDEEQPLTIDRVTTTVRVEVLGKTIDVPFVDDGTLNVYKTEFFEKEGKPAAAKRFPAGVKVGTGPENAISFWVAFRESDFDFDAACRNLANAFNLDLARARNAGGAKTPFEAVAGVAKFDAAKMEQARKELLEKLPAALADQMTKRVVAEVTAKSGLASGTRTVNCILYKPAFTPEPAKK